MKHSLFLCLLVVSASFAQDAELNRPVSSLEVEDGDSIVFLGDSITHQRLYTQYVEDFFYTRFPHMRLKFHNAGVGGARAWDALARFDRDVAAYKPKYVTVLLGMNDGQYQPYSEDIFRTYHDDMTTLIGRITEAGATPILMTPTMFDARAARARKWSRSGEGLYNSVLAYYGTWLREVAVRDGHGFVDMWGRLNNITLEQRKSDPAFTLIQDAVHPGPAGQLVMAYSIIEDMGLRKPLSNIRIVNGRRGPRVTSSGGKVTDLVVTDDGLEFTFAASGLPWVLPPETEPAGKLLHLGHRASREALEVHVLPPGRYELRIDGDAVGTFTDVQLSRHIELQSNEKTPQYQQALQVAMLNKKRNAGPIGKLRGIWSRFQGYARKKRSLEENPTEALRKEVEALEQQLADRDDRIRELEAEARAIEDEIFVANQPRPRRYSLVRVSGGA